MSWEKVKLDKIVKISKGKKYLESPSEKSKYRYINIEDLHGGNLQRFTNENGVTVNPNDVIIAWDGANAGKVGVGFSGVIGSTLAKLCPTNADIHSKYLFWYLDSINAKIKSQRTGATIPHVNGAALKDLQIPLPPLHIQKQIANILDKADALRKKDQQLLQKYDELAHAIFIDMFGNPVKNEKGWEVKKLRELLIKGEKISYGVVQPGDNFQNGVPIVRVGDFKLMGIDKSNLKRINPEIEKKHKRTRLVGDEVLIACVGSVGKIALADQSLVGFNIVRATAKVRVDNFKINRVYLAFHLNQSSIQNYFISETRTSSQPTLNIKQIEETSILVPPIELQNNFNKISSNLLKQIDIINQSNSDHLFQSLLQKAFTGKFIHD